MLRETREMGTMLAARFDEMAGRQQQAAPREPRPIPKELSVSYYFIFLYVVHYYVFTDTFVQNGTSFGEDTLFYICIFSFSPCIARGETRPFRSGSRWAVQGH